MTKNWGYSDSLSDYDPRCSVLRVSVVQNMATEPVKFDKDDECTGKTAYVIVEHYAEEPCGPGSDDDEDPAPVCKTHHDAWMRIEDDSTKATVIAPGARVSDEDVAAAIASILQGAS